MYRLSENKKSQLSGEVNFQYSRSSGPGGQKVNKTETRVELLWDILVSETFRTEQKNLIQKKLASRFNKQGVLLIYSDQFRTRPQNQKACLELFFKLLEQALTRPKKRRATKPTKSSVEKRLKQKKQHSDKKRMRGKIDS